MYRIIEVPNGETDEEMPLVPIIVGAVIGGALVIALIGTLIFYCLKKRRLSAEANAAAAAANYSNP